MGSIPSLVRVFLCPCVGPFPSVGKEWDRVTLKAKVIQKEQAIQVGLKKLKVAVATMIDLTASIPLDILEEHIQSIEIGKVYLMEPLQVRIWSNKKKLATQKKTNIMQIKEDQELNAVELQTQETTEPQETIMVKRFKRKVRQVHQMPRL